MIVVTDTSVVLNLAWLGEARLLELVFQHVVAPDAVKREFERLAFADPRFHELQFPEFIEVAPAIQIPDELAENDDLDEGEIAALALAIERGIRNVLIDEKAGRIAARALGLKPSGLLGLLVEAKRRGLINAVLPLADALRDGARFRMTEDLRKEIAMLAGERE